MKENVEIPFELEINKVYHFYCYHQKKRYQIYINNYLILDAEKIPYNYPGNLENPIMFQLSSIDKSITPVEIMKSNLTDKELSLIYNAGEMCDNSMSVYIKDYKKRLITKFPNTVTLEPFDINQTAIANFNEEWSRICISNTQFHNNDGMPPKYKSHKMRVNNGLKVFYIRLNQKLNNFKKLKIKHPNPEDAEFWYIMHYNLKQYLSSNNMFSIIFSFIHSSKGSELIVLCSLLHRNPFFLNLLVDLGGIELLKDMIIEKQANGLMDSTFLFYLFNIACNEPITTKIEPQYEEIKRDSDSIIKPKITPKINETLMDFLDILILIVKKVSSASHHHYLQIWI